MSEVGATVVCPECGLAFLYLSTVGRGDIEVRHEDGSHSFVLVTPIDPDAPNPDPPDIGGVDD